MTARYESFEEFGGGREERERTVYEITIHFGEASEPLTLPVEDLEPAFDKNSASGWAYVAVPGGRRMPMYLGSAVTAVIPNAVEDPLEERLRTAREAGRDQGHQQGREEALEAGREERDRLAREERAARESERAEQSGELDMQILSFLARFKKVTLGQLMQRYPIFDHFERSGHNLKEAKEFFGSPEAAHRRLEYMKAEDLIEGGVKDYEVTHRGAELVGLHRPSVRGVNPNGKNTEHARAMVNLYQQTMHRSGGKAVWITNVELLDSGARADREAELGLSLPVGQPSYSKGHPATPEAMLVYPGSREMFIVGLELTRVNEARLRAYEELLAGYSSTPGVDGVMLYFLHDEARQKVAGLIPEGKSPFFSLETHEPTGPPEPEFGRKSPARSRRALSYVPDV